MDNDSIYFDYVEYKLPVLSVSDNNIYEMLDSIVTSTINCEEYSRSFDIDKISYILNVGKMNDSVNKDDCFYVEAYEENDVINYIGDEECYGVLSFKERLFFVKKYAEKYFTKTSQTKTFTLSKRNNFDFVVLNSLRDAGAGFRGDTNKVTIIDREGRTEHPLMSKREVARIIVDKIESLNQ